jgi:hypothetical protein
MPRAKTGEPQLHTGHGSQSPYGPEPDLRGGICIVVAICVLGAVLSFPGGW